MLKKIILSQIVFLYLFNLNAQEQSNIKLKIETGLLWDSVEGRIYHSGPFLNVEPKLKTSKNTVIGLRIGAALNTQRILISDPSQFYINNNVGFNGVISLGPTFDYYFTTDNFRPYLGIGFGHNFLTTTKNGFDIGNPSGDVELSIDNQVGLLFRGGFDLHKLVIGRFDFSKFDLGLAFNYIPKSDVELSNGQKIGTVVTSNVALSIGHTIGEVKGSK